MKNEYEDMLKYAYDFFNARDIESLLSLMQPDVSWPNGWEGGYVQGHNEVRDYWTRQWKQINPTVKPLSIAEIEEAKIEVTVHQIVADLEGNILMDGIVKHVYSFREGMVQGMEIKSA